MGWRARDTLTGGPGSTRTCAPNF